MSNFQFKLDKLLKLRENHRDQAREKLAQALQAVAMLDEQREQIDAEVAVTRRERAIESGQHNINVERLISSQRYELLLAAQMGGLEVQKKQILEEVERRRAVLVEADRQVKVLAKLRDRRLAQHQKAELVRELRVMDEIAGESVQRRRRGDS